MLNFVEVDQIQHTTALVQNDENFFSRNDTVACPVYIEHPCTTAFMIIGVTCVLVSLTLILRHMPHYNNDQQLQH
jgi:hypothetical protein